MKYYFLDSTALAFAYAPGNEAIRELVRRSATGAENVRAVVCDLSLPEAVNALIELQQAGAMEANRLALAVERLGCV